MTIKTIFISIFDGKRIEECYKDVDTIIDGYGLGESSLVQLTLKYKDGTIQSIACHSFEIEPDEVINKNHGCGTTFDDLIAMADKIDMGRKEEAKKYLESLLDKRKQHIEEVIKEPLRLDNDESVGKLLDVLDGSISFAEKKVDADE